MLTEISNKSNLAQGDTNVVKLKHSSEIRYNTRSNTTVCEDELVAASKASLTYGEATSSSIFKVVQTFKLHGFNFESTFLDIGSGYGKVVFDVACQSESICCGQEIVYTRYIASQEVLDMYIAQHNHESDVAKLLSRVFFE